MIFELSPFNENYIILNQISPSLPPEGAAVDTDIFGFCNVVEILILALPSKRAVPETAPVNVILLDVFNLVAVSALPCKLPTKSEAIKLFVAGFKVIPLAIIADAVFEVALIESDASNGYAPDVADKVCFTFSSVFLIVGEV